MKKILNQVHIKAFVLVLFVCFNLTASAQNENAQKSWKFSHPILVEPQVPTPPEINNEEISGMPEFPGGNVQLKQYLEKEAHKVLSRRAGNASGKVAVGFEVGKDGSLSNFKILKSTNPSLNDDALGIVKSMPKWKPVNYSKKFYGLMTLRRGVELSKNLMTVRLAQDIGMDKVVEISKRVGVNDHLPPYLSSSLGAADTRVINMVSAYCVIVNGGKKVPPYMIERIQDRKGRTIYKHEQTPCPECEADKWENQKEPDFHVVREQVVDPLSAYQMTSILEGVATRGTGARLNGLHRHLAGKTGTTNETKDAWFVGFSPDLVAGVYVGFDEPESLGRTETGAASALPIFYDFMKEALKDTPDTSFRIPAGIKLVRVNPETGKPSAPGDRVVIIEALKPDFDFNNRQRVIGDEDSLVAGPEQDNSSLQIGGEY